MDADSEVMPMTPPQGAMTAPTKKRKAGAALEKGTASKKARPDAADRLTLLYVRNLPTKNPRQASALLVGFNTQQLAQQLYNELYLDSDTLSSTAEQHLQALLDRGIELSPYAPGLHVVTDGPPSISLSGVETQETPDARVKKAPLRVFVAKKFPSRSLYPEVAVVVAATKDAAAQALADATRGAPDNRPGSVKARGQEMTAVDLSVPGFYRLSEGDFYDYERN